MKKRLKYVAETTSEISNVFLTLLFSASLSKGPDGGAEKPEPEQKLNKTQALKKVFKEYGAVGVSFHIGISLISLGIFYIVVSR